MPKIHLPNIEEVMDENDIFYESVYVPRIVRVVKRSLLHVEPGDIFISPIGIERDFLEYISDLSGLDKGLDWYIEIHTRTKPYSLIDSVLRDGEMVERLFQLSKEKGWAIEAYIESPRAALLSEATRIPLGNTYSKLALAGLIKQLNDKWFFKELCRKIDIETVPGYYADDLDSIKTAVLKVGHENNDRIIVKKTQSGGGLGNLVGDTETVIQRLEKWYNTGGVVVEHFMGFAEIVGSLVTITDKGCQYYGLNRQIIQDACWKGFHFGSGYAELEKVIEMESIKISKELQSMGARGEVNIDWGILKDDRGSPSPIALELNFRHNGFGDILHYTKRYLDTSGNRIHVHYYDNFEFSKEKTTFKELSKRLKGIRFRGKPIFIDKPGVKSGLMVISPPDKNSFSVAMCGKSLKYVKDITERLKEEFK